MYSLIMLMVFTLCVLFNVFLIELTNYKRK